MIVLQILLVLTGYIYSENFLSEMHALSIHDQSLLVE